jgi:DNA-binding winged helix-turn-helix (wHTH) protein
VQNPGKILTRDELLKTAWPDTFVDESSLVQSICVLRRALEEKPGDNSYIVTLPGRGYQFVSPVKEFAPSECRFGRNPSRRRRRQPAPSAATDAGYAALAGHNLAPVQPLQGDLAGAKQGFEQSRAIWQKMGDQRDAAYASLGLGSLLLQGADFSGARQMYEQALAIRTSARDEFTVAETQLGIADLSLEEAHSPVEQAAAMRQVIEVFQKRKARDDETLARCVLARALPPASTLPEKTLPTPQPELWHAMSWPPSHEVAAAGFYGHRTRRPSCAR